VHTHTHATHSLRRARVATVGLSAALGVAVAACGSGTPSGNAGTPPPTLELSACTVADGALQARCGTFRVAEDPAHPQGRQIALHVVVLPATGTAHVADPLLYFAGYGGAASKDAQWAAGTFARLNQTRDILMVDMRGTGGSNRMECPSLGSIGTASSGDTSVAAVVDACLQSVEKVGDPRFYTTPNGVDDVDRVRAALGYDKVNVYGASYGVSAGLAYVQRHGEHVRTALFDSGSLLDVRLWESGGRSAQQGLDTVLARCAADARCSAAFPHVADEWRAVLARLASSPPTLQVTDPPTKQTVPVVVTADGFLGLVSDHYLGSVQTAAGLPKAIHAASTGSFMPLVQEYLASRPTGGDPRTTLVVSQTIACSDEWAQVDAAQAKAVGGDSPFTAMVVAEAQVRAEICSRWPTAVGSRGPVHTDAPVVFLNGTADTADPPANVAAASATMPNSLVVPVVGYAHGQLSQDASGLLASAANTFLQMGRPAAAADWAYAQHPLMPAFVVN
jgi:pimeloyl-ACP methyl ester carboxylesterase